MDTRFAILFFTLLCTVAYGQNGFSFPGQRPGFPGQVGQGFPGQVGQGFPGQFPGQGFQTGFNNQFPQTGFQNGFQNGLNQFPQSGFNTGFNNGFQNQLGFQNGLNGFQNGMNGGFQNGFNNQLGGIPGQFNQFNQNSCHMRGCPGGQQCVYMNGMTPSQYMCPTWIPILRCQCMPGCRAQNQMYIGQGQSRPIDQCGNMCTCNSPDGQASCTMNACPQQGPVSQVGKKKK